MKRYLTEVQMNDICNKYKEGCHWTILCKMYKVSCMTIYRVLKEKGISGFQKKRKPLSPEMLQAHEEYLKGTKLWILAEKHKINPNTLYSRFKRHGLITRQKHKRRISDEPRNREKSKKSYEAWRQAWRWR